MKGQQAPRGYKTKEVKDFFLLQADSGRIPGLY